MRRLAMAGGGAVSAGILLWSFTPMGSSPSRTATVSSAGEPSSPALGSPVQATIPAAVGSTPTSLTSPSPTQARRTYALGLHELAGLSPDTPAGTQLELWVTWEPPVSESVHVQRLLKDVLVERMIPPSLPEGPTTVLLSVPAREVSDLLDGDRFGDLSAVTGD